MRRFLLIAALAATTAALFACGGDNSGNEAARLTVNLTNWDMEPSAPVVKAGTVSFTATHGTAHTHGSTEGGATHQLLVARLNDGAKPGQAKFSALVLHLNDIKPGEQKSGDAVLEPGTYELACLVVENVNGQVVNHYEKGMYTALTVE